MSEFYTRTGCLPSGPRAFRYKEFKISDSVQESDLPSVVDMGSWMPPVYDQGNLGSCTANAIAASLEYVDKYNPGLANLGLNPPPEVWDLPSRLWIYYNGRALYGAEGWDIGLSIPAGLEAVGQFGIAPEEDWPYDISKFTMKPPERAYEDADKARILFYRRIPLDLRLAKIVLAFRYPIIFGVSIDRNFMAYQVVMRNGIRVIRKPDPASTIGEHAMLICGYRQDIGCFNVRNSWTQGWGESGYCWMPFEYLLDPAFAFDFFYIWGVSQ